VLATGRGRVIGGERMKSGLVLAVALVSLCEPAFAEEVGPYVYGSGGVAVAKFNKSPVDSRVSAQYGGASVISSVNSNPTTYKVNFGYQLLSSLGFELGYGSTTSIDYSTSAPVAARASEKLQIWDALVSGSYSLGAGFILTFRGGIANLRATGSGAIAHFSGSATEGVGGAGIKYEIDSHLSVRVDWDNGFRGPGGSQIRDVNFYSAGIGYNF